MIASGTKQNKTKKNKSLALIMQKKTKTKQKTCCKQVPHIHFQHFQIQTAEQTAAPWTRDMERWQDTAYFLFWLSIFFQGDTNYIQLLFEQQMASCGKMSGTLFNLGSNKWCSGAVNRLDHSPRHQAASVIRARDTHTQSSVYLFIYFSFKTWCTPTRWLWVVVFS